MFARLVSRRQVLACRPLTPRAGAILLAGASLVIGLVFPGPLSAQDVVFGGEAAFASGIQGDASVPGTVSPFVRMMLSPELSVFADTAELRAAGSIGLGVPGEERVDQHPGLAGQGGGKLGRVGAPRRRTHQKNAFRAQIWSFRCK